MEFLDVDQSADLHILDTIDLTRINEDIDVKDNNVIAKVSGIMDEQLTCSICSELFVSATTLNCTHSFCFHCISIWKKKRRECPICRKPITAMNKSLVLDNFIESMIDNLPTDLKARRTEILQERAGNEKDYINMLFKAILIIFTNLHISINSISEIFKIHITFYNLYFCISVMEKKRY